MIKRMPKWNELFANVLEFYSDGKPHVNRQAKVFIADNLNLTEEQRNEVTELIKENKIEGRIGFAISALKISGLLKQKERGTNIITEEGMKLVQNLPDILDEKFLIDNYESYRINKEKNALRSKQRREETLNPISDFTPEELIDEAVTDINLRLANELLERLYVLDPFKFEHLVAELLKKMGYGDLTVTKKSNDGGIDAIVNEDKLGLDKILVQTKRYAENNIIYQTQIRDFLGVLAAEKVAKGIFVTTSSFDEKAKNLAKNSEKKIILIDGENLTKLMIEHNIGTSGDKVYEIKSLDIDYFEK